MVSLHKFYYLEAKNLYKNDPVVM